MKTVIRYAVAGIMLAALMLWIGASFTARRLGLLD